MERWIAKVIALAVMFLLPFVFTLMPLKVSGYFAKKGAAGRKFLSCLMCFGGGVFLATFLLHMAPESRDLVHRHILVPYGFNYPLADLLMGAGFFIVLYIEKIVIKANKNKQKRKMRQRREQCMQFNKLAQYSPATQYPVEFANAAKKTANGKCECSVCDTDCDCEGGLNTQAKEDLQTQSNGHVIKQNVSKCPLLGTGECCNDPVELRMQDTSNGVNDDEAITIIGVRPSNDPEENEELDAHNTRSLVLLLALSLHRIFEGMTLGLQQSIFAVFSLLGAVMCHEVVIGFSLGLQFVKNNLSTKRAFLSCFLVSLILPGGAAVGMVIVEFGDSGATLDMANGVLQSIATGTFIYVTFFEILQEEIGGHDTSILKITSVLVGFIVMALITLVPENTDFPTNFENATASTTTTESVMLVTTMT